MSGSEVSGSEAPQRAQQSSSLAQAGEPLPPGPAPRRPSVSMVLGVVFALLLLTLGLVAVHDAIAGWGLIGRRPIHDQALSVVDGLRPGDRMLAAAILALIVGGGLIIASLRQRRYETYRLKARTGVHLARHDLARLIEDDVGEIPGVSSVRVRVPSSGIRVEVSTTGGEGIEGLVEQAVEARLADLAERPRVRLRCTVTGAGPGAPGTAAGRKTTSRKLAGKTAKVAR